MGEKYMCLLKNGLFCLSMVISAYSYGAEPSLSLTIYSSAPAGSISSDFFYSLEQTSNEGEIPALIPGYASIHEERDIDIKQKQATIQFANVSAYIDPTTVMFKSLTDPEGTRVIEQSYDFNLVNNQQLLELYLGREITLEQVVGNQLQSFTGTLLNVVGPLVLQGKDGKVTSVNNFSNIRFANLPSGLLSKPTLIWEVSTNKTGTHRVAVDYQSKALTWWADYNALYEDTSEPQKGYISLGAWVNIINKSGKEYENTKLKLIAGNINRVRMPNELRAPTAALFKKSNDGESAFSENAFFESHLYTLERQVTLPNNGLKQIALFQTVKRIPVQKQYIYFAAPNLQYYGRVNTNREFGTNTNTKVDVYLKFKNIKQDGLGIPLPAGRIRVQKVSPMDNSLEFIGEDVIGHVANGENVLLKTGSAFDLISERKQIKFNVDDVRHIMEETFEVTLKNQKSQDVTIFVKENMYRGANWQILENTTQYEKIDAQTVQFPVVVKKEGESKLQYTIRYTW